MRVAAIHDIHANLPALEAVLAEIVRVGVDRVVVGGDVVPGPMPRETITALLDLPVPVDFLRGNGENDVLSSLEGGELLRVPENFREVLRWVGRALAPEHATLLAGWPQTVRLEISGLGEVLFCHATPRSDNEVFTRLTPEERLVPIVEAADAAVVVCGHTHMQFDRPVGEVRVVNAGSVGMPFGEPGAYWLLLGPDIELRHTAYDLTEAAERIRESNYPWGDDFASGYVVDRPSEAEMSEIYERAALQVEETPARRRPVG